MSAVDEWRGTGQARSSGTLTEPGVEHSSSRVTMDALPVDYGDGWLDDAPAKPTRWQRFWAWCREWVA